MTERRGRLRDIEEQIGRRRLIWFGTRGTDARPLLDIPQFAACLSLIAPLGAVTLDTEAEVSLETLSGVRVDLNSYDIDLDTSDKAQELHRRLMRACDVPSVLVAYRPTAFLASAYFPRAEFVDYLGLFYHRQALFEHKPWVESELRRLGVTVLDWRYFADDDRGPLGEWLSEGPLVLRANRTDGGAGLTLIREADDISSHWPAHHDGFLAASRYLESNIPLNVNACVFHDGVTLHPPSLQLIGIPVCTSRKFGYCGNDFARVRDLGGSVLDSLEKVTLQVGEWLRREGYLGAFGVDAMVHEGRVYLTEVNPRFQGSSAVAAILASRLDRPDLFIDHIGAFLGLGAGAPIHLRDLAREQESVAQIVCYNSSPSPVSRRSTVSLGEDLPEPQLLPAPGIEVEPEGTLFKVVAEGAVTDDGHGLSQLWRRSLQALISGLYGTTPLPRG